MRISAILCAGLVAWTAIAPSADSQVMVRYLKGQATFISAEPQSVVQVGVPEHPGAHHLAVMVVALNRSTRPESLGYENVTVRTTSGAPVKLLTYEELQHQARVRAGWATAFGVALTGLSMYAAIRGSYYGGYHGYGYYSPVAAQIGVANATAISAATFSSISQQLDATMQRLDGEVLRTTTIDPGDAFGGAVVFDLPPKTPIQDLIVTVSYAGETHELALNATAAAAAGQASAEDLATPRHPMVDPTMAMGAPPPAPSPQPPAVTPASAPAPIRAPKHACGMWTPTSPDAVSC
jgi:hypothetical protein